MTTEEKTPKHATGAIVAASAAMTLAVGITVAALSGHLTPLSVASSPAAAALAPTSNAHELPKATARAVVLVPVTSEPPSTPPELVPSEPLVVAYDETADDDGVERAGHDDDEPRARHHREHAREGSDDDD